MPPKSKEFVSSDESEAESTDSDVEIKKKAKKTKKSVEKVLFYYRVILQIS